MKGHITRIWIIFISLAVCWSLLIGTSLWFEIKQAVETSYNLAVSEAQSSYNKDLVYRRWASTHGGVYVPPSEKYPANEYLSHIDDRDILTTDGSKLTLVNPAYMTRQVHDLSEEQYGLKGNITSLNPLRPENEPDEWERKVLMLFEEGIQEYTELMPIEGVNHLRFMRSMVTDDSCLKCHENQGYQIGDIRGGISVSIPYAPYEAIAKDEVHMAVSHHFIIGFLGLLGLFLSGRITSKIYNKSIQGQLKLQLALKSADFGTLDWDSEKDKVFYDQRFLSLLGYNPGHLKSYFSDWEKIVHEDDWSYVTSCLMNQNEEEDEITEFEIRLKHRTGEWIWFLCRSSILDENLNGEPLRVCFTFVNITEHKLRELGVTRQNQQYEELNRKLELSNRELFAAKEYAEQLIDTAHAIVVGLDMTGNVITFNKEAERVTGYTKEELGDKNWFEVIAPKSLFPEVWEEFERLKGGGLPQRFENPILTKSGAERHIVWNNSEIYNNGEPAGSISFGIDITDQKEMAEALQQSNAKYRSLYQHAPLAYQSLDADGRILDINPQWTKVLGYNKEDAVGRLFSEFLEDEFEPRFQQCFRDLKTCGHLSGTELKLFKENGESIIASFEGCIAIDSKGNVSQIYCTFQDVTIRRQTEEALLEAKEKAELANKAKDDFLAVMSHELRTPLNPIMGYVSVLQSEIETEPHQTYLNTVMRSSNRMVRLIDDILQFSRIQKDGLRIEKQTFELIPFLREIIYSYRQQGRKNDFIFENGGDHLSQLNDHVVVESDQGILSQILNNLLSNANKYTEGGSVTLRAGLLDGEQNTLRIEVQDNGIGISEDKQKNIFDPFVQADSSYTRQYQGIGLGLAICHKLVDLLEGKIGVQSENKVGSLFWIEIPLRVLPHKKIKAVSYSDDIQSFPEPWKILVAEDQPENQAYVEVAIKKLGGIPTIVSNGVEAVEAVTQHDFDLILMDLSMPEMDGFVATEKIRKIIKDRSIPIIPMTAHNTGEVKDHANNMKMDGFIVKPVNIQSLSKTIISVLQK